MVKQAVLCDLCALCGEKMGLFRVFSWFRGENVMLNDSPKCPDGDPWKHVYHRGHGGHGGKTEVSECTRVYAFIR